MNYSLTIHFDHQVFAYYDHGGIPRYFQELISALNKSSDIEIKTHGLFIKRAGLKIPKELWSRPNICIPSIPYPEYITGLLNDAEHHLSFRKWSMRSERPQVIHQTYHYQRYKTYGIPVVQTIHDLIYENHFGQTKHKSHLLKQTDHFICVSESTRKDFLERYNCDPSKVTTIHHGYTPLPSNGKNVNYSKSDRPYILYVGNRSYYKNFEILIQAFSMSKLLRENFELVCFGGGKLSDKEKVLLHKRSIPETRVQHVQGNDFALRQFYENASLFVYPSLCEGFGLPLLEAMGADCPVVCSDIAIFKEVAKDAAIFFNPHSPDDLVLKIEKLIHGAELRQKLVQAGQERIKAFSWEQCAQNTSLIYRNLCK